MTSILKQFTKTYDASKVPSLSGTVHLVTGGSNGIGCAVARTLYHKGAKVYITGYQEEIGKQAVEYIKTGNLEAAPEDYRLGFGSQADEASIGESINTGEVEFFHYNAEDLNETTKFAKGFASRLDRLDVLWGIAGKGTNAFKLTPDGYDSHFTMNNLAHHVIISHLFPVLEKTSKLPGADVRIVQMSSELHRATFGGPSPTFGGKKFATKEEFREELGPDNLYARTKLAVILQQKAIVKNFAQPPSKILVYSTHPGAVATGQQDQFKPAYGEVIGAVMGAVVRPLMLRPDQGAISILWAGTAPDARSDESYKNGMYFNAEQNPGSETAEADDQELLENLWTTSEAIINEVTNGEGLGPWKA